MELDSPFEVSTSFVSYLVKISGLAHYEYSVAGELGGIQVTGQQVTCIGNEIMSASSMDNNILEGSNSEQVGCLDSNIMPNGTILFCTTVS
jgi:hypothetical protein